MPFALLAEPGGAASAASTGWLGEAAAIGIADNLDARGFDAFSHDERVMLFDRLQLPMTSGLTRATVIRAGELLGATLLVIGDLRAGETLAVRARVIRLDTAQQLADLREEGPATELFAILDRLTASLARAAADVCPGRACVPAGTPLPRQAPDVFESYVKGLVAMTPAVQQRYLEQAVRKAPRDARVQLALWDAYTEQGLHAKALAAVRMVPADSPLFRKTRFCAALTMIELGRLDEASRTLAELHAARPSPVLANALGVVQLRRSPEAAVAHFKQAVDLARDDTDFLFNLGYASALAGDSTGALAWLRQVVRLDATDGDAHRVMSVVLGATGRLVESQRESELAKLLGARGTSATTPVPDKVPPGLERMREDLDAPPPPRPDALGGSTDQDQQEVAAFHLGEGKRLLASQRDRDAGEALRRAIYLAPYQDEPHLLLGGLHERAGRLADAIDEYKVALWCRESVGAHLALGAALLASGDKPAARIEAQRALQMQPGSVEAKALLEKIDR